MIAAPSTVDAVGAVLLHFLWQGAALALLLWAALRLARGAGPTSRYGLACATLAGPAARSLASGDGPTTTDLRTRESLPSGGGVTTSASVGAAPPASVEPGFVLRLVALAWVIGVLALSARLAGGALRARRLTRRGRPAEPARQGELASLARRMGVRRAVRLVESALVASPATLGWLRPVVIVPASLFAGLTPRELEAILAHELAHIRRHDFLVNLLQLVSETLLFYHPAVWWVSRVIARERELICDDLAVDACGNALVYARALTRIERMRGAGTRLALAADGGEFYERVRRLVAVPGADASAAPRRGASVVALALAALVVVPGAGALVPLAAGPEAEPRDGGRSTEAMDARSSETALPAAESALGGKRGCAVVVDARDGRILATVNEEWAARRAWPAASTFKLVTSVAALSEGAVDPDELVRVGDAPDPIGLDEALARSSNRYFERLGAKVGAVTLLDYARRLGLGVTTGSGIAGESAGRLPTDAATPRSLGGFGEGVLVTPLQLARLVAAIASDGEPPQLAAGSSRGGRRRLDLAPAALRRVKEGMLACTRSGTAFKAFGDDSNVAGKTGTVGDGAASMGLFACFAPADAPRWIVVVALEGRDVNGAAAAKVAAKIVGRLDAR
jgi:beta-lactamase regulating signal transducer with metallopeptidase domain